MRRTYGNEAPSVSVFRGGGSVLFPKVTPFSKPQKKVIFALLSAEMGSYVGKKN